MFHAKINLTAFQRKISDVNAWDETHLTRFTWGPFELINGFVIFYLQFIEKFQEVKEATKNISGSTGKTAASAVAASAVATNGSSTTPTPAAPSSMGNSTSASANASPVSSRSVISTTIGNNAPVAFSSDEKDTIKHDCNYLLYYNWSYW